MPKLYLFSPTGVPIIGTRETIPGISRLSTDEVTRNSDGTYDFEYADGTDVSWDGQETVTDPATDQRIFVDANYDDWPEGQLVLRAAEDEDEETA